MAAAAIALVMMGVAFQVMPEHPMLGATLYALSAGSGAFVHFGSKITWDASVSAHDAITTSTTSTSTSPSASTTSFQWEPSSRRRAVSMPESSSASSSEISSMIEEITYSPPSSGTSEITSMIISVPPSSPYSVVTSSITSSTASQITTAATGSKTAPASGTTFASAASKVLALKSGTVYPFAKNATDNSTTTGLVNTEPALTALAVKYRILRVWKIIILFPKGLFSHFHALPLFWFHRLKNSIVDVYNVLSTSAYSDLPAVFGNAITSAITLCFGLMSDLYGWFPDSISGLFDLPDTIWGSIANVSTSLFMSVYSFLEESLHAFMNGIACFFPGGKLLDGESVLADTLVNAADKMPIIDPEAILWSTTAKISNAWNHFYYLAIEHLPRRLNTMWDHLNYLTAEYTSQGPYNWFQQSAVIAALIIFVSAPLYQEAAHFLNPLWSIVIALPSLFLAMALHHGLIALQLRDAAIAISMAGAAITWTYWGQVVLTNAWTRFLAGVERVRPNVRHASAAAFASLIGFFQWVGRRVIQFGLAIGAFFTQQIPRFFRRVPYGVWQFLFCTIAYLSALFAVSLCNPNPRWCSCLVKRWFWRAPTIVMVTALPTLVFMCMYQFPGQRFKFGLWLYVTVMTEWKFTMVFDGGLRCWQDVLIGVGTVVVILEVYKRFPLPADYNKMLDFVLGGLGGGGGAAVKRTKEKSTPTGLPFKMKKSTSDSSDLEQPRATDVPARSVLDKEATRANAWPTYKDVPVVSNALEDDLQPKNNVDQGEKGKGKPTGASIDPAEEQENADAAKLASSSSTKIDSTEAKVKVETAFAPPVGGIPSKTTRQGGTDAPAPTLAEDEPVKPDAGEFEETQKPVEEAATTSPAPASTPPTLPAGSTPALTENTQSKLDAGEAKATQKPAQQSTGQSSTPAPAAHIPPAFSFPAVSRPLGKSEDTQGPAPQSTEQSFAPALSTNFDNGRTFRPIAPLRRPTPSRTRGLASSFHASASTSSSGPQSQSYQGKSPAPRESAEETSLTPNAGLSTSGFAPGSTPAIESELQTSQGQSPAPPAPKTQERPPRFLLKPGLFSSRFAPQQSTPTSSARAQPPSQLNLSNAGSTVPSVLAPGLAPQPQAPGSSKPEPTATDMMTQETARSDGNNSAKAATSPGPVDAPQQQSLNMAQSQAPSVSDAESIPNTPGSSEFAASVQGDSTASGVAQSNGENGAASAATHQPDPSTSPFTSGFSTSPTPFPKSNVKLLPPNKPLLSMPGLTPPPGSATPTATQYGQPTSGGPPSAPLRSGHPTSAPINANTAASTQVSTPQTAILGNFFGLGSLFERKFTPPPAPPAVAGDKVASNTNAGGRPSPSQSISTGPEGIFDKKAEKFGLKNSSPAPNASNKLIPCGSRFSFGPTSLEPSAPSTPGPALLSPALQSPAAAREAKTVPSAANNTNITPPAQQSGS